MLYIVVVEVIFELLIVFYTKFTCLVVFFLYTTIDDYKKIQQNFNVYLDL